MAASHLRDSLRRVVACLRPLAPSFADPLENWLEHLEHDQGCSLHTLHAYARDVGQMAAFAALTCGLDTGPKDVDLALLRAWLRDLAEHHLPATRSRKISALRSFLGMLVRRGELATNPALELFLPKVVRPLPTFLHDEDAAAVVEACETGPLATVATLRDRAVLEVLYGGGLRVAELCALNLDDVRRRPPKLMVTGRVRQRAAPLGSHALAALHAYIDRRHELRSPNRAQDTSALFLTRNGTRLASRRVQTLVRHYGALGAGRPDVHPHVLRHSFATSMLNGGADLSVVHKLLGNERFPSTERYQAVAVARLTAIHQAAHPLGRVMIPARREPGPLRHAPLPARDQGPCGSRE